MNDTIGWTDEHCRYQRVIIDATGLGQITSIVSGLENTSGIFDSIFGPAEIPYFIHITSSSKSKFDY
jgi:hypothetical protein